MMLSPEPILDIVRGLSTIASGTILFGQVKNVYQDLFVTQCNHCRGTGRMTCPMCHGYNKYRSRPLTAQAAAKLRQPNMVEPEDATMDCFRCGDRSRFDNMFEAADNEDEAYSVMDNLKAAMGNKAIPKPLGIMAGTIPCPECKGRPKVHLYGANLEDVLNLALPWDFKVAQRVALRGSKLKARSAKQKQKPRVYLEYPGNPVTVDEIKKKVVEKKTHAEDELGAISMKATDQLTLKDYVLRYIDEDEEEDT